MTKPRLLDLYCCEGGASVGYSRAGFKVTGVDLFKDYNQKRYPFKSYKSDAIDFVNRHGHKFDVIAASPPCQNASIATSALRAKGAKYPELIGPTRAALIASGKPYVIENVKGAALRRPAMLCGCMFDLQAVDDDGILLHMQRERFFESNMRLRPPRRCNHKEHTWVGGSYGGARRDKYDAKYVRKGGYVPSIPVQRELLGIDWMTQNGMFQSIPPAYTEHLGKQIMRHLRRMETAR